MKSVLVALCFLAFSVCANAQTPLYPIKYTVATLPAAGTMKDRIVSVTDSLTQGDCAIGGGTLSSPCRSNGTAWVPWGDGTGPGSSPVSSVSGVPPINSSGGSTPAISIDNGKADGLTKGAVDFLASDFNDDGAGKISLDYANGQAADATHKGFLISTDWSTFNAKQDALGFTPVPNTRTVNGHALSANVTVTPGDLSLVIGTNTEAWNAKLDSIAALANATGWLHNNGSGTFVYSTPTASDVGAEVPLTFSTGLTRTANTVTINTTQNILKISGLTTNGPVYVSGGDGTLNSEAVVNKVRGGTGVNNSGNITVGADTNISGGGTFALGGFTFTVPATGTAAMLNQPNSFTLINPLTTISESWIGPSSTAGIYFKGGKVGIGATDPLFKLQVDNGASAATRLRLGGDGTATKKAWNLTTDNTSAGELNLEEGTTGAPRMTILQGGNVGIGAVPTYKLDVNGTFRSIGTATFQVDANPLTNYTSNLGAPTNKYLSLNAAELIVENLVAADVRSTVGGRVVVAPTTELTVGLTSGEVIITVKHNNLSNGDRIHLESRGQVEFMAVTSGAGGSAGSYTYSVVRNLDGSGANDWLAGDGVVNTRQTGDGFIDLYAASGILSGVGPTIVGNVRTGTTYNNIEPRWAIGNLNGLYGYSGSTYGAAFGVPTGAWIKVDPTNGVRIGFNTTTNVQIDASGNATFAGALSAATGTFAGSLSAATGTFAGSLSAATGSFSGSITSTSGTIGGFSLGADYIRDAANSFGLASTVTGGDDVRFWAGDTFANRATAPFRVTEAGAVTMISGSVGGWTINSTYLAKDTGTNSTSAGMAPTDYPFFAGGTYANRASAAFRVTPAGVVTASSGNVILDSFGVNIYNGAFQTINPGLTTYDGVFLGSSGDPFHNGYSSRLRMEGTGGNGVENNTIDWIQEVQGAFRSGPLTFSTSYDGASYQRVLSLGSTNQGSGGVSVFNYDAATNTASVGVGLTHNSSGTPAASFGNSILFNLQSSTTADQNAASISAIWTTATHASRTSALVFQTVNNAGSLSEVGRFAGNGDFTITGVIKAGSGPTTVTNAVGKVLGAALVGTDITTVGTLTSLHVDANATTTGEIGAYYQAGSFANIRGAFVHGGNAGGYLSAGGLQIAAQGAANSSNGSGDTVFLNPGTNSANNSTDATLSVTMRIKYDGSVVVGSPAGGGKGFGAVNAQAVYDDNVLLTDWVFDPNHVANAAKRLFSLEETRSYTLTEHRLPWMPTPSEFENARNVGGMVTRLWQGQEQQQLYILDLESRIRALEVAVKKQQ
jgi:hypothetical protein